MKGLAGWLMVVVLACVSLPAHGQKTVRYIHTDALGSVVAVTDANRNVIERREYEPYGAQMTPAVQDGPGYTGHVQDAATGLVYMQQRYYDPVCGCFVSVDPVTAYQNPISQFHRYRYANNNPYTYTDPNGEAAQALWGAVIGAGVEIFIQTQIQGRSFSEIDRSNVAVAAGAGALTAGVASAAALSAARGSVTVGRAVAETSLKSGAIGTGASVTRDLANGEAPDARAALVDGAASAALGAVGQRVTLNPLARLENQWSRGGLNSTVADTTRDAIVGTDAAVLAAGSSATGAHASDAASIATDIVRARLEEPKR